MHKKLLVIAITVGFAINAAPAAAFGLPKLSNPLASSSGGGDVEGQVNKFQDSALLSNNLLANSSVYMLRALVSKERGADLQKQLDTINQISDPKEKNAELAKLVASNNTELATLEKNQQTKDQLKKASTEKKKAMGAGLFNMALGLLQVDQLTKSGTDIVSGVSKNPLQGVKVLPVKDTLPVLSSLASNGKSLLDTGLRLAKSADIKPELPTTTEVRAQELDPNAF